MHRVPDDKVPEGPIVPDEQVKQVIDDLDAARAREPDAPPPNALAPSVVSMDGVERCRFGLRPDGLQDLLPCKPLREHARSTAPGLTLILKKFSGKHPVFGVRPPQRFGVLLRVSDVDQGVLLNWCPFCRESVHRAFKEAARG